MVTSCTAEGQGVQAVQQRVRGYKLYSRGSGGTSKRKEESKSADSSALLSEILLYSRRLRGREASGVMMYGTVRYGRWSRLVRRCKLYTRDVRGKTVQQRSQGVPICTANRSGGYQTAQQRSEGLPGCRQCRLLRGQVGGNREG